MISLGNITFTLLLILATVLPGLGDLPQWEFESNSELHQWVPNSHMSSVVIKDGLLRAETTGWDPFILCRNVTIEAKPYQYVVLRLKADRPGIGELFWTGELEGQYGGLTEKKKVRFSVRGEDSWQEIAVFPFWHAEGAIRQLRLDLYERAHFEFDWVRVQEWSGDRSQSSICVWGFGGDTSEWQIHHESLEFERINRAR
jgi:hypothetical protein